MPACVFLLAACGGGGGGQSAPPIHAEQWAKAYGGAGSDIATSVQPTADGGYIVAASTESFGAGGPDAWVLKLDARGNVVWQKTYGDANNDLAYYVQQTSDGGYIVAGETHGDAWILKLDASGNVIWQKAYGSATGRDSASAVQETPDGGYIVAGLLGILPAGYSDAWVFKLDSSGNVVWQKTYGGTGDDVANSIQLTADHGYIVAGDTDSSSWILKLDADGNVIWQKTYDGGGLGRAYSAQPTVDGGYIVAGSLTTFGAVNPGLSQAWVLKLDANGTILWQRVYGGASDEARSVHPTADGGYIVTATTRYTVGPPPSLLLKLDALGNVMWQRAYGFFSGAVQTTPDGGYVVAGSQWAGGTFPPHAGTGGHSTAFVAKLDVTGVVTGCAVGGTINAAAADGHAIIGIPMRTIAASNATTTNTTIVPGNSAAVPFQECP